MFPKTLQFSTGKSWYPLTIRISLFSLFLMFYNFLYNKNIILLLSFTFFLIINFLWYRDLTREAIFVGRQNVLILVSIKLGIIFIIIREIFFFLSFFWTFFHFIFIYSGEIGFKWPSLNITRIDYLRIPLLNTLILLRRGLSLTLSHFLLLINKKHIITYLFVTIILGVLFTICQVWEYFILEFLWSDSCYGSIFYMGTGFHGVHVIIGFLFLIIILIRRFFNKTNSLSNVFELSSWYWHFVDVVWIFLFSEFYWLRY